jgi:hypothetical protein
VRRSRHQKVWHIGIKMWPKRNQWMKNESEQRKRWEMFLAKGTDSQIDEGANLLHVMEMTKDLPEDTNDSGEEKTELNEEIIKKITVTRSLDGQGLGEKKRKQKIEPWGPVLVDRQKRRNNSERSMLQRALELKKKKNLEQQKGNSFVVLQTNELNQVAMDVNIKIGRNSVESSRIIKDLVEVEKGVFDKFVGENPEVLLPSSSELEEVLDSNPMIV